MKYNSAVPKTFILLVIFLGEGIGLAAQTSRGVDHLKLGRNEGPYVLHALDMKKNSGRLKNESETRYRLSGYAYELDRPNGPDGASTVILEFSQPSSLRYTYLVQQDTTEIRQYEMGPEFDYTNESLLALIPPAGINNFLLRSSPDYGKFYGHFLSQESKQKINNDWKITASIKNRARLPFGYEYGSTYVLQAMCPYDWVSTTKGEWKNALWVNTLDVTLVDCNTQQPYQYGREIRKFDEKNQQVEFAGYTKQSDRYDLSFHTLKKFDAQQRVIEQLDSGYLPDPSHEKKTVSTYDEKGNPLTSVFVMQGSNSVQSFRTIAERASDGSYLYTFQRLLNGEWKSTSRETYLYDSKDRLTRWSEELWDSDAQQWYLRSYNNIRYASNNLVTENEYYSAYDKNDIYGIIQKTEYDENDRVKTSDQSTCSGAVDCAGGNYKPLFKAYYENRDTDELDYFKSYIFTDDHWVRYDSVANLYNDRGEIQECFWRMYTGTYPEKIDLDQRQVYRYDEWIVTGNEPSLHPLNMAYPNPATDKIYIDVASDNLTLEIMDLNGRTGSLQFERLDEKHGVADVSYLQPGLYVLKLKNGTKIRAQKLIKR